MANASGTAEVGLLNLMKHKMSRGTFNEGHEPSKSAEAEGPCPESEETKAESKENEESEDQLEKPEQSSESEKAEHGKNEPDAGDESLKLLSDETGGNYILYQRNTLKIVDVYRATITVFTMICNTR